MHSPEISVHKHSGCYTLYASQWANVDLDRCWDFFSDPRNLGKLTPPEMDFRITSREVPKMFAGQLITYRIGILPGVKSSWVTEITQVNPKKYFIDEQRFGPYSMWHHKHGFEAKDGGVLLSDEVSFKLPMGALGRLFGSGYVKKQVRKIFEYRATVIDQVFANELP